MRQLGGLLLWLCISFTHACEAPIRFQVGSFFSTNFIIEYWQPFALELGKQSGCQVTIQSSSTYEQYLDTLASKEADIFMVPNHYVKAFIERGLTPVLVSEKNAKLSILSSKNIKKHGSAILIGETILVPSPYTRAFLELKKWLAQENLTSKVSFDFNHSYDSATLLMLQGKHSTAVVLNSILRTLPPFFQNKYQIIPIQAKGGATLLTKQNIPNDILDAIYRSKNALTFHAWSKASVPYKFAPFSDEFTQQLKDYLKNKKPSQ